MKHKCSDHSYFYLLVFIRDSPKLTVVKGIAILLQAFARNKSYHSIVHKKYTQEKLLGSLIITIAVMVHNCVYSNHKFNFTLLEKNGLRQYLQLGWPLILVNVLKGIYGKT